MDLRIESFAAFARELRDPLVGTGEGGRVVFANRAAEVLLRHPAGGLIGLALGSFVRPGDQPGSVVARCRDGTELELELTTFAPLGLMSDLRVTLFLGHDPAESEALRRTLLIEERRRATLERVIENAPIGIGYMDREFRYVLVNEMLARINGKPVEAHIGRSVAETLPPDTVAPVMQLMQQVIDSGEPFVAREYPLCVEGRDRFFDGGYYPVRDAGGVVEGLVLLVIEQTEQVETRRRIEALAAAEQQRRSELLAVIESAPNAIALFGPDDRLRHASRGLVALVGPIAAESTADELAAAFRAGGAREPALSAAFGDRACTAQGELWLPSPPRAFRWSSVPVHDAARSYVGRVFAFVDVTAERELDQKRVAFLSLASHELRTPLTPLGISLQTLERQLARGQPVNRSFVRKGMRQLSRLRSLIDDLLDFSRLESGRLDLKREALMLDALAAEVVSDLDRTSEEHAIVYRRPEAPVQVVGDAARLEQVLVNLLLNAVKYTPLGGEIAVAVRAVAGEAEVSIRDPGIGIPAADRPRLFERFFRASNAAVRNYPGMGVGLYLSKEIIRGHGGRFEVESEEGRGSEFRFYLPLQHSG